MPRVPRAICKLNPRRPSKQALEGVLAELYEKIAESYETFIEGDSTPLQAIDVLVQIALDLGAIYDLSLDKKLAKELGEVRDILEGYAKILGKTLI